MIENAEQKGGTSPDPLLRAVIAEMDRRYEQRFVAQEKATEAAMFSAKEAVTKAENAAERRFEGLNELRGVVMDILGKTLSRAEGETGFVGIREKLSDAVTTWDARHQEIVNRVVNLDSRISQAIGELFSRKEAEVHQTNDNTSHSEINSRLADLDKRISVTSGEKSEHKDTQSLFRSNVSMFVGLAALVLSLLLLISRVWPVVKP